MQYKLNTLYKTCIEFALESNFWIIKQNLRWKSLEIEIESFPISQEWNQKFKIILKMCFKLHRNYLGPFVWIFLGETV